MVLIYYLLNCFFDRLTNHALWYHPDGVGTLVALAHIFRIELRIFMNQGDGTARRVLFYTPDNPTGEIINLLHTYDHFELLEIQIPPIVQLTELMGLRTHPPKMIVIQKFRRKPLYLQDSEHYLLPNFRQGVRPRITVVFDLDETLIFNRNGLIVLRPHTLHLLERLQNLNIEIILWTASDEITAREALRLTGIRDELFDDFIFRDGRWYSERNHRKDLRLLGRDISRVMIVDNSAHACRTNQRNAVLVEDFLGELEITDNTLINILEIIHHIHEKISDQNTTPKIIETLATQGTCLTTIQVKLPEKWTVLSQEEKSRYPLDQIPAHGEYFKAKR